MMTQRTMPLGSGADSGQQAALFLEKATPRYGWRVWLLPMLLMLVLLAPLMRWGLPATAAGVLPLYHEVARQIAPAVTWLALEGEFGYKLTVGASLFAAVLAVAWLARGLWGAGSAWWLASLWLMLPLTVSLLYQRGWPHLLQGVALLAGGGALLVASHRAWRWLGVLPLLGGAFLLWEPQSALYPYQLLASTWGDPSNLREWLAVESYQLGVVPLVLALLAGVAAWPRRAGREARWVLGLLGAALLAALLTLVGGPILLWLAVASLALVLAAGGLPALDARYRSLPMLLALLTLAVLPVYPYLETPWLEAQPAQPTVGAFIGDGQFLLLDVQYVQGDGGAMVEATWQVTGELTDDYTAFVHLLNAEGQIIGQADSLLVDEAAVPSSGWPVGYLVRQQYPITGDPAPTHLRLGLYDLDTLARLPVAGGGDSVTVPVR